MFKKSNCLATVRQPSLAKSKKKKIQVKKLPRRGKLDDIFIFPDIFRSNLSKTINLRKIDILSICHQVAIRSTFYFFVIYRPKNIRLFIGDLIIELPRHGKVIISHQLLFHFLLQKF